MLFFAKAAGIAVIIWFYMTAKEKGQPTINWAVIGLVGYWITWWVAKFILVNPLSGAVAKSAFGTFALIQIPALCALAAAFLIRKKLIADAAEKNSQP